MMCSFLPFTLFVFLTANGNDVSLVLHSQNVIGYPQNLRITYQFQPLLQHLCLGWMVQTSEEAKAVTRQGTKPQGSSEHRVERWLTYTDGASMLRNKYLVKYFFADHFTVHVNQHLMDLHRFHFLVAPNFSTSSS